MSTPGTPRALAALDDPSRAQELRARIRSKPFLKAFYLEVYAKYADVLRRCPADGQAIELGSGAGFVKELMPFVITSDVLSYSGVDQVIDAMKLPFPDRSLRAILMLNVFHHIADVARFLAEAERCLKPGGRIFMLDQNVGWINRWILKYAHHEPFEPKARDWAFPSTGPLSGANGALATVVFKRDLDKFQNAYPGLKLVRFAPHSPLRYWVSGGLKTWSASPGWAFSAWTLVDRALTALSPNFGSFVDIEIVRR